MKHCCICDTDFEEYGNNPAPFDGETCCDDCNDRFVVPARMIIRDPAILPALQRVAVAGKALAIARQRMRSIKGDK